MGDRCAHGGEGGEPCPLNASAWWSRMIPLPSEYGQRSAATAALRRHSRAVSCRFDVRVEAAYAVTNSLPSPSYRLYRTVR